MILIGTFVFYYYIAHEWAEGMVEVSKEYACITSDLNDTIPIYLDTAYHEIKTVVDSMIEVKLPKKG